MFRKLAFALILVVLLSQFAITAVVALDEPVGSCPEGFSLVPAMHHEDHHHRHVGTHADLNADGHICMKPVSLDSNIHVHVDNNLP
jgi:hypothetical protein